MMFCYLTGTPCLAIDNVSHKLSGVFSWIKDCSNILVVYAGEIGNYDLCHLISGLSHTPKKTLNFSTAFTKVFSYLYDLYKEYANG